MMNKNVGKWVSILVGLLVCPYASSCTVVFANDKGAIKIVARSMDLYMSDMPMILTQPQGKKRSGQAGENSLKWTSKYGSLVVTALHKDIVSDGMNEKGLAAHLLYLTGSEYTKSDANTPKISNTLWAQYILDNFATVDEAIKATQKLNMVPTEVHGRTWPIHLAIEDASGDSAVIEFIKGAAKIYHGSQYRVMTNEPAYDIQLANLKRYKSFGGDRSLPGDSDPLSRFVRAATYLKTLPQAKTEVDSVAGVLSVIRSTMVPFGAVDTSGNNTSVDWPTRWITVADITNKLFFFNSTSAPNIIWFDLNKINFSKGAPVLSIDPIDIDLGGDVTKKLSTKLE